MTEQRNWKRIRDRLALQLPVRVRVRETLFTSLDLQQGRFVRVSSEQYRTTAHAAIRSRHVGADGIARIHVEFIDTEWPL